MSMGYRSPYDRMITRRRRSRALAWCFFLLFLAAVFVGRILVR
jgi:hypothetical protein